MSNFIKDLALKIKVKESEVEKFFADNFQNHPALIYNSVDLRNSNFKLAPVDTNCFPAGFNNLSSKSLKKAKGVAQNFLNENHPEVKKIIIIPENHTRNFRYLENICNLQKIFSDFCEVKIGTLIDDIKEQEVIDLENGEKITLNEIINKNGEIETFDGFKSDLIILNNDLSDGIHTKLQNLKTKINPNINLGWFNRSKFHHFEIYNKLAVEISNIINIDPWLISSIQKKAENINFKEKAGLENLSKEVENCLNEISAKYQEYGIDEKPYCFVKADSGTYGMGIWPVSNAQEILEINKKERSKMNVTKGSVQNSEVIIQEGIVTIDKISGNPAEPMQYLINGEIIGNLFRANESRDNKISLNSTGVSFYDLVNLNSDDFSALHENEVSDLKICYSFISKLASLAAAIENSNLQVVISNSLKS